MKALLLNVDSRWNLALRRMYAYYTQQGHTVEMRDLGLSGYPHKKTVVVDATGFDQVHVSNLFEVNAYRVTVLNCDNVIYGGIGSRDPKRKLPEEIEETPPYYFPEEKTTYGYITRGCIRNCYFCKVPKYEGKLRAYNAVESIIRGIPGETVKFLDNNILAYKEHMSVLDWLAKRGTRCTFIQGLDFRLVNEENLAALARLNYKGEYIFAFDDPKYQPLLDRKIVQIKKHIPKPWKLKFYIYYHPNMDLRQLVQRVEWCRSHECLPYVMRDAACWDCEKRDFLIEYASYCNTPGTFLKLNFKQFLTNRRERKDLGAERMARCLRIYEEVMP